MRAETVEDLWAHARELAELALRDFEPAHLRRALVTLAVAGSAGDAAGFAAVVALVHHSAVKLAVDPVPLFDAASALVPQGDHPARQTLVTFPRRDPRERRLADFGWREGRGPEGFRYEPTGRR